ncbi:MAG: hypothetical protein GF416_07250 [Candidatus Altiarchaeales archaeon]|nr:hypothetical protein [Candidatus Altiarchaeales archaeon]MBD3416908.1 hypothetical protein [Candidatus Altiarchaeales archaeon]
MELWDRAADILRGNDRGGWTVPSADVYPYQWLWDSGFIAEGLAALDLERAFKEIESVFRGQWKNGMVPHIRFEGGDTRFYPRGEWDSRRHSGIEHETSGITQTPILADTAHRLYQMSSEKGEADSGVGFLERVYDRLRGYHLWLWHQRKFEDTGLLVTLHPDENGMDDSPMWDGPMSRVKVSEEAGEMAEEKMRTEPDTLSGNRPSEDFYAKNYELMVELKTAGYDTRSLDEDYQFRVLDVLFNSVWAKSNRGLAKIASVLGEEEDSRLFLSWADDTVKSMDDIMWDPESRIYHDYDTAAGRRIKVRTVGSFTALFSGLEDKKRAAEVARSLEDPANGFATEYMIPSTSTMEESYDEGRFWRGPIWPFTNYIICEGLRENGLEREYAGLRDQTLELAGRSGFRECFTIGGAGTGVGCFSATAAIVLSLLSQGG